ncbi:MAG: hypothetical protein Q9219_007566 [cf. Caloplaca sp. 3 TL-2023]
MKLQFWYELKNVPNNLIQTLTNVLFRRLEKLMLRESILCPLAEGIALGLQSLAFKDVKIDTAQKRVTVNGGILMKELQVALSREGEFTTVANGNTVGAIPYAIGGGISSYTPLIGYACENILSARIVVASGEIVTVSENKNKELLWAIRGAGQFFGIVTEITLRTYDPSLIGPNGVRQLGMVFFPTERAYEVCRTLLGIVSRDDNDHASAGHFMVMKDPSKGPILMVAPQYFGTGPELQETFRPLTNMDPIDHQHQPCTFEDHSDHLGWMCPKGEFKRFSQTGLTTIDPENFTKLVDLHENLVETLPDTQRSVFTIEWHTKAPTKGARETETSFGLKHVDCWLNILTWYTDSNLHERVLEFDKKAQEIMRADTKEEAYIAYTNTSRDDPVEHRYKDAKAVEKLKQLKRRWDPDGCFTRQFL